MGRTALIVVMGFGVLLSIMSRAITGRTSEAGQHAVSYYGKTMAKNIASSAAEICLREIEDSAGNAKPYLGTYTYASLLGGSAKITVTNIVVHAPPLPDSIKMVTISSYGGIT